MLYSFTLTIPHNTLKNSPVEVEMLLTAGIVRAVYLQFPVGTRCTTHVIIEHEGHQYLPTNPDGDITSDGYVVPIENEDFHLELRQCKLKAKGWSTADTYDYNINIFISLERLPEVEPSAIAKGLSKLIQILGIKV